MCEKTQPICLRGFASAARERVRFYFIVGSAGGALTRLVPRGMHVGGRHLLVYAITNAAIPLAADTRGQHHESSRRYTSLACIERVCSPPVSALDLLQLLPVRLPASSFQSLSGPEATLCAEEDNFFWDAPRCLDRKLTKTPASTPRPQRSIDLQSLNLTASLAVQRRNTPSSSFCRCVDVVWRD